MVTPSAIAGDTAVVGAPTRAAGIVGPTAHVFVRSGDTWTHRQALTDTTVAAGDGFGYAVDLDGDRALVGAPGTGAAYVFERAGVTWATAGPIAPSPAAPAFGAAVAISGRHGVIGAPSGGPGAVYFE